MEDNKYLPYFYPSGERMCKLIIDGGNTVNIVLKFIVKKLNLKVESHLMPYKVA